MIMQMQVGSYVRVPVIMDTEDQRYPRAFVLARIKSIDWVASVAEIQGFDLLKTRNFYPDIVIDRKKPLSKLMPVEIPIGTTVKTSAGFGKVMGIIGKENKKYVIWIDNVGLDMFEEKDIEADYTMLYQNPAEMLINYEFQHPSWFLARSDISRQMHILNNGAYGFSSITGSRIFLKAHQIMTVARCVENRPVRYMLADEVGLGKTIEACSVIKVLQEHQSDLQVLYVLPEALVEQWRFELITKFSIEGVRSEEADSYTKHHILTFEELLECSDVRGLGLKFDLVLIDEGHHILKDDDLYERTLTLSKTVEHILLLSATPIQDRKEEYLRLLTLLNPKRYEDMEQKTFDSIVDKQQLIQEQLYSIYTDLLEYEDFKEDIFENISEIASSLEDAQLTKALTESSLSEEEVYDLIGFISEYYRVDRNVIRNRRAILENETPPRELIEKEYYPGTMNELYPEQDTLNALLDWLQREVFAKNIDLEKVVIPVIMAAYSSPWALLEKLTALKEKNIDVSSTVIELTEQWAIAAETEFNNMNTYLDEDPDSIKGRLLHCIDFLDQEMPGDQSKPFKAVIFTSFKSTLLPFFEALTKRFGKETCASFYEGMSRLDMELNIDKFQSDPDCRILVCDELGGEGRNFQIADLAIHLDIPWEINKVEQRIGRLDRIGRSMDKNVKSVVFYALESLEEQLFVLWRDGMGVFEASLSGMEIVSGDVSNTIKEALKDDLNHGLANALPSIKEEMNRMIRVVQEEQFYDLAALMYGPLSRMVSVAIDKYEDADSIFARSMRRWSEQSGFKAIESEDGLVEFKEELFNPRSSEKVLLAPPNWNKYTLSPMVKRKGSIVGTYNRKTAVEREDLLYFAPGDPVFDAVISNALNSYRGRVGAFTLDNAPFHFNGFVFIWNIEPNMRPLFNAGLDPTILVQFRSFLPVYQPFTMYPLDDQSAEVTDQQMVEFLENVRAAGNIRHLGSRNDEKGRADVEKFMAIFPPETWTTIVNSAQESCEKQARKIVKDQFDLEEVLRVVKEIIRANRGSNEYFGYDSTSLAEEYTAILNSLKNFRLILDSALYLGMNKNVNV